MLTVCVDDISTSVLCLELRLVSVSLLCLFSSIYAYAIYTVCGNFSQPDGVTLLLLLIRVIRDVGLVAAKMPKTTMRLRNTSQS